MLVLRVGGGGGVCFQYFTTILYVYFRNSIRSGKSFVLPTVTVSRRKLHLVMFVLGSYASKNAIRANTTKET